MADTMHNCDYSIVKLTAAYAAGDNIPGVCRPYLGVGTGTDKEGNPFDQDSTLDMALGASILIEHNGTLKIGGSEAGAGVEVYPGNDITNGDIKCSFDIEVGDMLLVRYGNVQLREIGG